MDFQSLEGLLAAQIAVNLRYRTLLERVPEDLLRFGCCKLFVFMLLSQGASILVFLNLGQTGSELAAPARVPAPDQQLIDLVFYELVGAEILVVGLVFVGASGQYNNAKG